MVAGGVMAGEIILASVARPIPVRDVSATIVIVVARVATATKVLVPKVGMTAAVAMNVVMEVVHVESARAVAAVKDARTKARAVNAVKGARTRAHVVSVVKHVKTRTRVANAASRASSEVKVRVARGVPNPMFRRWPLTGTARSNQLRATFNPVSHRTTSATGLKVPKRMATAQMATDRAASARNVAASGVAAVDADAVDVAVVAVAKAAIERLAR
jgi:regulator of extracellular matrix RemA (YlzA/DUF370 family)